MEVAMSTVLPGQAQLHGLSNPSRGRCRDTTSDGLKRERYFEQYTRSETADKHEFGELRLNTSGRRDGCSEDKGDIWMSIRLSKAFERKRTLQVQICVSVRTLRTLFKL